MTKIYVIRCIGPDGETYFLKRVSSSVNTAEKLVKEHWSELTEAGVLDGDFSLVLDTDATLKGPSERVFVSDDVSWHIDELELVP